MNFSDYANHLIKLGDRSITSDRVSLVGQNSLDLLPEFLMIATVAVASRLLLPVDD